MEINKSLEQWITDNNLSVIILQENIIKIDGVGKFLVVSEKDPTMDERFVLNLTDDEINVLDSDVDYLLFKFGSLWYYHHKDSETTDLNLFRYLGKSNLDSFDLPFLGLHGKYELCNGSRDYKEWVKKLKFLGYKTAGICELQTLAGNHYFQDACDKAGLKCIHGRTNKVKSKSGYFYFVKSFAKNQIGWKNLLKIHNTEIITRNLDNQYITEKELQNLSDGLIHVIDYKTELNSIDLSVYDYENSFYQFNTVQYSSDSRDKQNLLNLKNYLDNYKTLLKPLIMQDSYYLDKGDSSVKPFLNKIIGSVKDFHSEDEYLKPFEQFIIEMDHLFNDKETFDFLLTNCFDNYKYIQDECTLKIGGIGKYLPKYKMNIDESAIYSTNEEMFFSLIEKGFSERIAGQVDDENIYIERLEKEIQVLQEGNVVDYFLILYDVFNWMKQETGILSLGRGSAAGSLVSYCLGIVQVDPIKYDLIFERFLNKSRLLSGSLPDIDSDIPSAYRKKAIDYLIEKYGRMNVTCIGTAQDFKLKSAIKDFLRTKNIPQDQQNLLTSIITQEENSYGYEKLFEVAIREKLIKNMIMEHPDIIYMMHLVIGQARSFGIHAAGIIIFPEYDDEGNKTTAFDYVPLRYSDDMLVTEWEKNHIESEGFLKADLLGLKQLDKIIRMNELIQENGKEVPEYSNIDLNDPKVFDLFKTATTEDIFQFNTDVQKGYLLSLNPDSIDDLIAANALNRPGTMEINAHMDYVQIKEGSKEKEEMPLIDDILESTRSLIAYQEQVMNIYQRITNCDLTETDKFRKIISSLATKGTKEERLLAIGDYKDNFIKGYLNKGISEEDANRVWDKMEAFSSYSFNKSHASCYAITGYWAAFYKAYFPLEFYTSALEFGSVDSNKETTPRLISEIFSSNLIQLHPPDINKSGWKYFSDVITNSIYWSLISVKFAGNIAIETLLEERNKNGKYFSFEEFVERAKGTKVNKRIIVNFILCGCFDELENITEEKERINILNKYGQLIKEDLTSVHESESNYQENSYWVLLQKKLCGLGMISYSKLFKKIRINVAGWLGMTFYDGYLLKDDSATGKQGVVGGICEEIIERNTKNGVMGQVILNSNDKMIYVTFWPEQYKENKETLIKYKGTPLFISGNIVRDNYKKTNVIQTNFNTKIANL